MYTIKQAARLTGVSEASLRAWERRYGIVAPRRTAGGYRLYDSESLAVVSAMRQLVSTGWSPAQAAAAVRAGSLPSTVHAPSEEAVQPVQLGQPDAVTAMHLILTSAARMDSVGLEESLDQGFALGSFEHVVDSWLFPTLEALGEGWAQGEIDVAGEHAASHAVHRRLSAAFDAAGSRSRGPSVVVGLPPGSHHELGALAFATATRRIGLDVLYLGADVPVASWDAAVRNRAARAAVLTVVTDADRATAIAVAKQLLTEHPGLLVVSGGAAGSDLTMGVRTLAPTIAASAQELDLLLHDHGTA
jgi:DNA-binding transcriptional MerR regulator